MIICTHNPRPAFLRRTIDCLKRQSLEQKEWELLVIDNASTLPIEDDVDLSWHAHSRIIREPQVGLTPARLRGIEASTGEVLVFVDDDNLLDSNYLERALQISENYPFLGAWGGTIEAEYETPPPGWFERFEPNIAVRRVDNICWGNEYFNYSITPVGAGMCLRRNVAQAYLRRTQGDELATNLDRKGDSLMSCGDHDMAWTSITMSLGVGLFPCLKLIHLIPPERLALSYILRLMEADECSTILLRNRLLNEYPPQLNFWRRHPKLRAVGQSAAIAFGLRNQLDVQVSTARLRGHKRATDMLDARKRS
ncbi:glycosyltransferase family 2 protein [bacterium]|nr:glycosyltransferase family 2 protein [bacterium]